MKQQSSKIPKSTEQDKDDQHSSLFLPQKLKLLQGCSDQFEQRNEIQTITMDEILKQNFSIVISGLSGQGKTTIARQIDKQIKKIDNKQQIKSIFISAKNKIEPEFASKLKHYQFTKNQKQNLKHRNDNVQIEEVIIIDDFDVLLLQNQELLDDIKDSFCKAKCKFIYFVNESIKKHLAYQNWIQRESQLNQYQIIQLKKNDVKNHFEQFIPWEECLQNINLSQQKNNTNIIKSIGQKIQNNYNIENILIKIIKLSSIVDNMEQEAGNAMMILKELKCILQNFDFSFIRMKNSSFDFLSFHNCNFEGSQMENVDISKCWFISCKLNNVQWSNMVKHELQFKYNILKNKQAESIVFMNDHQFFIVCFWNLLIELWHFKACKFLAILRNDKNDSNFYGNYISTAFTSNGMLLASSAHTAKLKITSCQNGKIIRKLNQELSDYKTCPITFSLDNRLLAIGVKHIIYIWNLNKGQKILEFNCHTDEISQLQFFREDTLLLTCSPDGTIRAWDIKQRQQQKFIKKPKEYYQKFCFSPDLNYIASIGLGQNKIVVLDLISNLEIRRNLNNKNAQITHIAFSPSGKYIACGLKRGAVTLFSLKEKQVDQLKINTRTQQKSECFDIAVAKGWNQSKIYDRYEKNEIISLKFSNNESYLISGNSEGTIKFHDLQDNTQFQNEAKFYCLSFSRNGNILAFGCQEKEKVFLWDLKKGKLLVELTPKFKKKECFRSITFSFDEQLLAYCYDHRVMLWNFQKRELLYNIEHEDFVQEAIFSPKQAVLASCCSDRFTIFIWSVELPKSVVLKNQISSCSIINQIAFSPCGNFLAQGGLSYLCIWNIQSEKNIIVFEAQDQDKCYRTIAFSPDGKVLASGGNDEIALWNIKQGNKILNIQESTNYMKFSPNGQLLASAMEDSTIKIWDISNFTVQEPIVLTGHSQEVEKLDFSQDGTMLASSSYYDGQILVWHIQTENSNKEEGQVEKTPKQLYTITPFYSFRSDFNLNASHTSLKDAQITSDKGVNLIQLFLQTGGKRQDVL